MDIRKFKTNEPWIFVKLLLLRGRQLAQDFLDAEQLVDFGLTREQGVSVNNFAHDASNSPDVYLLAVKIAQKQLWSPVPSRRHIVGKPYALLIV